MKPGKCSLGTRFTEEKNAPLPEQGGQARDHFDASPVEVWSASKHRPAKTTFTFFNSAASKLVNVVEAA